MADTNYAFTSLSAADSIVLSIQTPTGMPPIPDVPITQFSGTLAINQVPECLCAISIGRNAYTGSAASIHSFFDKLTTMLPAKIKGTFTGDYRNGAAWPKGQVTLFEGYYVGFSYQKIRGNVHLVVHLQHWLADLGFSSCLSGATSAGFAASLAQTAIFRASSITEGGGTTGGGSQSAMLPAQANNQILAQNLPGDLWGALKVYLTGICLLPGLQFNGAPGGAGNEITGGGNCGGVDTFSLSGQNNRAIRALARIEGPPGAPAGDTGVTNLDYAYGQPLNFTKVTDTAGADAPGKIAETVGQNMIVNMVSQTVWDLLIQQYCSMFSMDLCPAVDRAIMMPSTPGWRGSATPGPSGTAYWRKITPDEYDSIDETGMLMKPLRGVVIHGNTPNQPVGNSGASETGTDVYPIGAYATASQDSGDGTILYQPAPDWLSQLPYSALNHATSNGTLDNTPVNSASTAGGGTAGPPGPTPTAQYDSTRQLYDCYARCLFIQNMLRGRSINMSGRLRFDIAPGSHVEIVGSPEQFLGSQDKLGGSRFGQVVRVTCEIDAEGRRAATAFQITGVRNDAENKNDRTSVADHPFFVNSMGLGGLPLLPEMNLL